MTTYSDVSDLLVGDITISDLNDAKVRHVQNATDEIDSRLGFMYSTPFTELNVSRPAWLLIKRIANFIASGRLLLEIDQAGEESASHAYGLYLLKTADDIITSIINGDISLNPFAPGTPNQNTPHGALVANADPYSMVEAFMGFAARPSPLVASPAFPFLIGNQF